MKVEAHLTKLLRPEVCRELSPRSKAAAASPPPAHIHPSPVDYERLRFPFFRSVPPAVPLLLHASGSSLLKLE